MSTLRDAPVGAPIAFDSLAFAADPFPMYERLRRDAPVCRVRMRHFGDAEVYALSRYRDCVALTTDQRLRRAVAGAEQSPLPMSFRLLSGADSMLMKDVPEHSRLRAFVNRPFARKAIDPLAERLEAMVGSLLDGFAPGQRIDLQGDYALQIPFAVLSEMVCADEADRARFRDISALLCVDRMPDSGIEQIVARADATVGFLREMIGRHRVDPAHDIVTALTRPNEDGDTLSDDEIIAMVFLLAIADYETTYNLITNGVAALLTHPDQLRLLKSRPELINSAVEEILRYTGTIWGTEVCYPDEDIELHGVTIPRGAMVIPLLASANRDPDVFENPDVFDITRTPNPHIAFGKGPHFCLGTHLARMETRVAIINLITRFPDLQLAVNPECLQIAPVSILRRFTCLPVVL